MLIQILEQKDVRRFHRPKITTSVYNERQKKIEQYGRNGGLPGICFIRTEKVREQKLLDQLETILDLDLRQVQPTTLTLRELTSYVRQLALKDGQVLHYQDLRRHTGITPITQKKLLYALEAVFIIRTLPMEGDYKGAAIFFEDQAEARALSQNRIETEQQWIGLIYRNMREQFNYRSGSNVEFFQYKTRGGAHVPLAIRTSQSVLGMIPVLDRISRSHRASAQSFLSAYTDSKVIFVTNFNEPETVNSRTLILPAAILLF